MAGDWIKMRTDLSEDPAVIGIAARVGLDEFAVVGRLQALWSWADRQSRDGNAAGVTRAWINRKVQCDGFAEAMESVRWLSVTDDGISFPNFSNHNGETGKTRALGKSRQKNKRERDARDDEVTGPSRNERDDGVTREEKRREEETPSIDGVSRATPGEACKAMKAAGMQSVNPSDPRLVTLMQAGITIAELVTAAAEAVDRGKPFAYALKVAESRRHEAAAIGKLPGATAPRNGNKHAGAAAAIWGTAPQHHGDVIDA